MRLWKVQKSWRSSTVYQISRLSFFHCTIVNMQTSSKCLVSNSCKVFFYFFMIYTVSVILICNIFSASASTTPLSNCVSQDSLFPLCELGLFKMYFKISSDYWHYWGILIFKIMLSLSYSCCGTGAEEWQADLTALQILLSGNESTSIHPTTGILP